MVTWALTTLWRFDFEQRTQLFCWTSHSFAVFGEQPCDLASVLISGDGLSSIAFAAAPFSCGPSLTTLRRRISRYCGALAQSDNSSQASIARVPDQTGGVNIRPNRKETLSFDPCWIKFPEGREKRPDQGGPAPKVYEILHPLKRRQPKPSLLTGGFDDCSILYSGSFPTKLKRKAERWGNSRRRKLANQFDRRKASQSRMPSVASSARFRWRTKFRKKNLPPDKDGRAVQLQGSAYCP